MSKRDPLISQIRRNLSEVENDLMDNALAGRIDRRGFLAHGTRLGLSLPLLGTLAGAMGMAGARPARAAGPTGGTLRVAMTMPAGAIDPVTIADDGGLMMAMQTAEYLCTLNPDFTLKPVLATSWSPNKDGSVWTFKIRQGVKFFNGEPMNADAVVASVERLVNPKNGSNALSAFKGVLSPGHSQKVDDYTVAFHLDAPNGNFPYVLSSDNYNLVILPANYSGGFEKSFIGTGPFKLEKYIPKVGASFVRNEHYWGTKALLDRTEFTFYADMQPQVLALQGGQVDMLAQMPVAAGRAILGNPQFNIISCKSSAHEQVHMQCNAGPFKDKRVRQALALSLNRKALVRGLFQGHADIGNDSPFCKAFPSTDLSVPQRDQDLKKARDLLEQAGVGHGFSVTLTTEQFLEIPDYAVLIKSFAKKIGIEINLHIESQDAYYGKAVPGQSDWLDVPLGITDYGNRGVPNVFLNAPLTSTGTWNAARFHNPTYDGLVVDYVKALDLTGQRAVSGKIEELLLDETPIIFAYFYNYLYATSKAVSGLPAIGDRPFLQTVSISQS
ncbi:MAG: ABC transporter substrate-binding protein [Proteobacteria bacterium]|nr:ABC transporter substrate-binding protein [Pseudomonadota bacterium]